MRALLSLGEEPTEGPQSATFLTGLCCLEAQQWADLLATGFDDTGCGIDDLFRRYHLRVRGFRCFDDGLHVGCHLCDLCLGSRG